MEAVKKQLQFMYKLLGVLYLVGLVVLTIIKRDFILSFSFGTLISAINFYLTYLSFRKLYSTDTSTFTGVLVGPLPKLILIIGGALICYNLPQYLPIVPFLIGVCLYAITYLLLGAVDYTKQK